MALGTNPLSTDTDGDGVPDGDDVAPSDPDVVWAAGSLPAGRKPSPAASSIYANHRNGKLSDVAVGLGLALADTPVGDVVYDDFDNDYDLDLLLFPAQGTPIAWVNDRAGKHHVLDGPAMGLTAPGVVSATSGDPYKSGNRDLLVFTREGLRLYRNRGRFRAL